MVVLIDYGEYEGIWIDFLSKDTECGSDSGEVCVIGFGERTEDNSSEISVWDGLTESCEFLTYVVEVVEMGTYVSVVFTTYVLKPSS